MSSELLVCMLELEAGRSREIFEQRKALNLVAVGSSPFCAPGLHCHVQEPQDQPSPAGLQSMQLRVAAARPGARRCVRASGKFSEIL